jgi:aminopeptidase 2
MSIAAAAAPPVRRLFAWQLLAFATSTSTRSRHTLPTLFAASTPAYAARRPISNQFISKRMASTASHADRQILPTNVVPTHYHLSLTPNFETFTYVGNVAVTLDVARPTSRIVLNALDIDLHRASLKTTKQTLEATGIKLDAEQQEATIEFDQEAGTGKDAATLNIEFTGVLNDKMAGFYRSSYLDVKTGEKKWLATTQMGSSA